MSTGIWGIVFLVVVALGYLVWMNRDRFKRSGGSNYKPSGGGKTPILDSYSRDVTTDAREKRLDPVIDRESEIERITQILSRRTKNNPILLGKAGVGKTAIVEGLAQRIVEKKVPESLQNKRVLALNVSSLIAGTKYRGEFEQRLRKVMDELKASNRTIILFIDEVHLIVQSKGAEGALDPSDIIKPALARGDLQAVGATTLDEYNQYIKPEASLERRFQPVMVEPPDVAMTIRILDGLKKVYEDHHKVIITPDAIEAAAKLSDKYIKNRYLPDKAIDLIDEASAMVRLEIIDAPEKTKQLEAKLLDVQQKREKTTSNLEIKKLSQKELEINEKIERLQLASQEEKSGTKLPEVKAIDIQEVLEEWTGQDVNN